MIDIIIIISTLSLVFYPLLYKRKQYMKGAYYQITKNSYSLIKNDKGKYAEYSTYMALRKIENLGGKFLFNIYIPKENNKTTEIDVLLICPKGIFVFECKNYSGWIFGHEAQNNWTQTLPQGRHRCHKEYFYNPIMQNATHIRYLKKLLGKNAPIRSIIVFSDRCILKNITVKSNDTVIVKQYALAHVIAEICDQTQADFYTNEEIHHIYQMIYPYTQISNELKEQHIDNIKNAS